MNKQIKNIFDLDSFVFDKDGISPVLFKTVMDGVTNINLEHITQRDNEINLFLKKVLKGENIFTPNQKLTWFDQAHFQEVFDNLQKDKDRSWSSALKDIKIYKNPLIVNDFSIFDILEKDLPNFKDVISYYKGNFAINKTRSNSQYIAPRPVLLLGEPGIGKTFFANTFAKLLKTPYKFFDSNSISTSWTLSGSSPSWRGADAGLIFKTLAQSDTISPIITLDEIDKLQSNNQNSPFSVFHQMFESENAKKFYDEFLQMYFDTSGIIYVLTANDLSKIPKSLQSRMEIFKVPNPNTEQMNSIIQNIYKNCLNGSQFFKESLTDKQLSSLNSLKPRDVQKIINYSINQQLSNNIHNLDKKNQILEIKMNEDHNSSMGFIIS